MIVIRREDVKEVERGKKINGFPPFNEGRESNSVVIQPPRAKNTTVFGILALYIEKE